MNLKTLLVGVLALMSVLSCGKKEDSDLVVSMKGSATYIINADAQSCENVVKVAKSPTVSPTKDVSAYSYSFQGMTLGWKNLESTAYVTSVVLEFNSAAFSHKCELSPDEVVALFYDFENKEDWNGALVPALAEGSPTTRTTGSLCRVRCGGATIGDNAPAFTAAGTITVKGFQVLPNGGGEKPIRATAPLSISNQ